ncbi:3-oxo-5-alpha-steroid 4-dehydrogenase-domain-containing protein [Lactarius deliciosus]|nr:3-oxo-5-alpha-steroid 4-dehydrogenase-domain-containing protein [Lactarius deliciosus]
MAMAEYFALVKQIDFGYLYSVTKQWFLVGFALLGPVTFTYDAPFGKFATPDSVLSVDGVKSWIVMELVSPLAFLVTTYLHPFSATPLPLPSLARQALGISPQFVLVALYLVHYLNRAIVSPLRTPSRSSSHLAVVSAAVAFNAPNGFLLAAFLTSASTASYLTGALSSTRFWAGIALWAAGFAGNVYHDEILLNIRRKAIAKGKARELLDDDDRKKAQPPHYAIPHGGLYSLVSFPNYLCEWVEWFGFALAAGPFPGFALLPSAQVLLAAARSAQFTEAGRLLVPFMDSVSPPWVFLFVEITTMVPRAVRGHRWYYERFKESYPRERRAVIPWLL